MSAPSVTEVAASPTTVHWGFFDGTLPHIAEVPDGGRLRVRSVQGRATDPVPDAWVADDVRLIVETVQQGPGPHIATGPITVTGAHPGDTLAVDMLDVRVGARYGINRMRHGGGLFPDLVPEGAPVDVAAIVFDEDGRTGAVDPGVRLPLRPFFGIVATAPPVDWGRCSSVEPRSNGGNLDCRELTTGSRLYLPVFVDGAGLSVGDGHAAQGDGEVDQTAVETCLEAELRVWVEPHLGLDAPVAVTRNAVITFGLDPSLDRAVELATERMLDLLVDRCGLTRRQAYRLASVAVDLRVTQVVNRVRGVHAMLAHDLLAQLDPPAWLRPPRPDGPRPLHPTPPSSRPRTTEEHP